MTSLRVRRTSRKRLLLEFSVPTQPRVRRVPWSERCCGKSWVPWQGTCDGSPPPRPKLRSHPAPYAPERPNVCRRGKKRSSGQGTRVPGRRERRRGDGPVPARWSQPDCSVRAASPCEPPPPPGVGTAGSVAGGLRVAQTRSAPAPSGGGEHAARSPCRRPPGPGDQAAGVGPRARAGGARSSRGPLTPGRGLACSRGRRHADTAHGKWTVSS